MSTAPQPPSPLAGITAPAPLRDLAGWLCWKRQWDAEIQKWRKVPYWANGGRRHGRHGRDEDRRQLTTFEIAKAAAIRRGFDGVGFAPLAEFGVCAIDFDDCVDAAGQVRADVLEAVRDTYAELSPSGNGVRAFVRGAFGNRKDHDYGLEVFSTAGFVTVTGNRLELVDLVGLEDTVAEAAPALRALVARCFGREEAPEASEHDTEPLGLPEPQLREMLDVLDPGMRHDPWLRVGMALHHETRGEAFHLWDEWSSTAANYPGSQVLKARWESFGRGGQRPVTVHALLRMAQDAGAHIDLAPLALADFDVVEPDPAEAAKPPRFAVVPDVDFMERPAPRWIVKGLVPEGELLVLFGESTAGKSFVALDVFGAVARGVPWRGLRVPRKRRVCFIVAEGGGGFRNRLHAYRQHYGEAPGVKVMHAAPNLLQRDEAVDVGKAIAAAGGADIVVIDTFAQTTPGANENAGEDMGKALAHCRGISRQLGGALVVLVHHAGKDTSKGARGWSGLKAAADAEIEVVRTAGGRYLRTSKQKDGQDGQEWGFELSQVVIGADEDGDAVTSCVVVEAAVPVQGSARAAPTRKLGKWEQHVVDAINEIAVAQTAGIERDAVIDLAIAREAAPEHGRDTRKQHAARALKRLLDESDSPYFMDDDGTMSVA